MVPDVREVRALGGNRVSRPEARVGHGDVRRAPDGARVSSLSAIRHRTVRRHGRGDENGVTDWQIPLGVALGYRRAVGASGRAISAYVSPFYSWARVRENGVTSTHGLFRVSFGVDAAVLPQVGVTVGYETGAKAGVGEAGATGGIFGLGVSSAASPEGER